MTKETITLGNGYTLALEEAPQRVLVTPSMWGIPAAKVALTPEVAERLVEMLQRKIDAARGAQL